MSNTVNTFQIGVMSEGQWVGDEILVNVGDPYEYSAVGATTGSLLKLPKTEYRYFNKEMQEVFKQNARERMEWIKGRKQLLSKLSYNIARLDSKGEEYDETLQLCNRIYPNAKESVLMNIRTKHSHQRSKVYIIYIYIY